MGIVLAMVLVSCAGEPHAFEGFRDLENGQVIAYRVTVSQQRVASGLGSKKKLSSKVRIDLEEEVTAEDAYALVVRDVGAKGEASQKTAARRLVGRRLNVDLDDGVIGGDEQAFGGAEDVAASDVAMLFTLFAPVLPSPRAEAGETWRYATEPVAVPWSKTPLSLTVTNEINDRRDLKGLDAIGVKSVALGNVSFDLPLVAPAKGSGGTPASSDDLIVNQLFESLFTDIDNPIAGVFTAIAAIPLAILAPFLAFGEAIGDMFGGSDDQDDAPKVPTVNLSGPLEIRSDTQLWDADGRVLDATGAGTLKLSGQVPELPGEAAELSGKTLRLDVTWKLHRAHASEFPEDRDPPRSVLPFAAIASVIVAALLAGANHRRLRRRS
jgi:hypothetical protein